MGSKEKEENVKAKEKEKEKETEPCVFLVEWTRNSSASPGRRHQYVLGKPEDEEPLRQHLDAWASKAMHANRHKTGSVLDSAETKAKGKRKLDTTLYPSLIGRLTFTHWTTLEQMDISDVEKAMQTTAPIDPQEDN